MGIRQTLPDEDPLLHCALKLDVMNQFLCDTNKTETLDLTESEMNKRHL